MDAYLHCAGLLLCFPRAAAGERLCPGLRERMELLLAIIDPPRFLGGNPLDSDRGRYQCATEHPLRFGRSVGDREVQIPGEASSGYTHRSAVLRLAGRG